MFALLLSQPDLVFLDDRLISRCCDTLRVMKKGRGSVFRSHSQNPLFFVLILGKKNNPLIYLYQGISGLINRQHYNTIIVKSQWLKVNHTLNLVAELLSNSGFVLQAL